MPLIEIDWHPGPRQLRVFGVSAMVASAILAAGLVWLWGAALVWALVVLALGATILLTSLLSLPAARAVYLVLTVVAMPIGCVVSFVLLAAFYLLLLTPVGLFFRAIGRDPLCRGFNRHADSYWRRRHPSADTDQYFHQF
jgi:hypothetical protein